MSSLFSKPKTPDIPKPVTIDEAERSRQEADRAARRKGRLGTIIAGKKAGTSTGGGAAKALLGG